jgi:hypothetical protein
VEIGDIFGSLAVVYGNKYMNLRSFYKLLERCRGDLTSAVDDERLERLSTVARAEIKKQIDQCSRDSKVLVLMKLHL